MSNSHYTSISIRNVVSQGRITNLNFISAQELRRIGQKSTKRIVPSRPVDGCNFDGKQTKISCNSICTEWQMLHIKWKHSFFPLAIQANRNPFVWEVSPPHKLLFFIYMPISQSINKTSGKKNQWSIESKVFGLHDWKWNKKDFSLSKSSLNFIFFPVFVY